MKYDNIVPVFAGFAIGIALIAILAILFKPEVPISDGELLATTREIKEVQYFLSRYPDAKPKIEREDNGERERTTVTYALEKDVYEPAVTYGGEIGLGGRTRELGLILEFREGLVRTISNPRMHVQCGGPISIHQSGSNIIALIEEFSSCLEKRLATNLSPQLSRNEVLPIARNDVVENLVGSHQIFEFREQPAYTLMPENKTLNPLIYVAQNGTQYLIDEENNNGLTRPCNLSDQQLCYPGDRDSQVHITGHLVYVMDVAWQENDIVGGGTRYMIDGNTGKILYPPGITAPPRPNSVTVSIGGKPQDSLVQSGQGTSLMTKYLLVNITQTVTLSKPSENITIYPVLADWDGIIREDLGYSMVDQDNNDVSHTGFANLVLHGVTATCFEPYPVKLTTDIAADDGIQFENTTEPVPSNIPWGDTVEVSFEEIQSGTLHYTIGYGIVPASYNNDNDNSYRNNGAGNQQLSGMYHLSFTSFYPAVVNLPELAQLTSSLELLCTINEDSEHIEKSKLPFIYVYDLWFRVM